MFFFVAAFDIDVDDVPSSPLYLDTQTVSLHPFGTSLNILVKSFKKRLGFCLVKIMVSWLLVTGYIFSSLINIISSTNCSAIDAYVEIISTSNLINTTTLLTSQALFPPYRYYVPFTELVVLDSTVDDSCDQSGISTDISNKIVLAFESEGSCSNHEKVYVAEQNNAIAILIANNDLSGGVTTIIDDDSITTTIPMRSITYEVCFS